MDRSVIDSLRSEEADLVRKLKAVRDFLAAYGEQPTVSASVAPVKAENSTSSGSREKVGITGFTENTRMSVVLAMMGMVASPGLVKTGELVEFVEAMGHTISGNNKVNALGALLSRSIDIESHGKAGWTVADRDRALAIISDYGPKENAPQKDDFSNLLGADAGVKDAPTSQPRGINPFAVRAG